MIRFQSFGYFVSAMIVTSAVTHSTLGQDRGISKAAVEASALGTVMSRGEYEKYAKSNFFDGLDVAIASRLEKEARSSIIEFFGVYRTAIEDSLKLDLADRKTLSKAIADRASNRQETLRKWRQILLKKSPVTELMIVEAVAGVRTEEDKHEKAITEILEFTLDPIQLDFVCKLLMGDLRFEFARLPLVSKHLKLTTAQVSKYELCRLANEGVVKKMQDTDTNKSEIDILRTRFRELGVAADDSLDADQFLFMARAVGFIGDKESLEDFYAKKSYPPSKSPLEIPCVSRYRKKASD